MDVSVKHASSDRWLAFWATMSGWILDAFDYNILAIILIDIRKSFTIDATLAGLLPTVTLFMRLIGGVTSGAAADRWGHRGAPTRPRCRFCPERYVGLARTLLTRWGQPAARR